MKRLVAVLMLLASGAALADGLQAYVADDLRTIESATQMALTARVALSNEVAVVLVKDGQVPLLSEKNTLVSNAQSKGVRFYVCDTDMRAFKSPSLPDGVEVVDTSKDTHESPRSTISRVLARECLHESN